MKYANAMGVLACPPENFEHFYPLNVIESESIFHYPINIVNPVLLILLSVYQKFTG